MNTFRHVSTDNNLVRMRKKSLGPGTLENKVNVISVKFCGSQRQLDKESRVVYPRQKQHEPYVKHATENRQEILLKALIC